MFLLIVWCFYKHKSNFIHKPIMDDMVRFPQMMNQDWYGDNGANRPGDLNTH